MPSLPDSLTQTSVGHPLPREVREEHQRERVIAAATEVFAKRGYQATTIDHLVAAAKMGFGGFYSLFDGKEDCFLQSYDRVVARCSEEIQARVPSTLPWPEAVRATLQALLDLISANHLEARLALVEVQSAGSAALARSEATLEAIVPHLERGREQSAAAASLPALEIAILGGVLWLLQQRILANKFDYGDALLAELIEIVAGPYLDDATLKRLIETI
jgi:AcrR family transcriptional regulator